jgi:hypothetical protein
MDVISSALRRKVIIWDNWPTTVIPLGGRTADLPQGVAGLLSNACLNENGAHPTTDFWRVLGTIGDYTWWPETYDGAASWAVWGDLLGY